MRKLLMAGMLAGVFVLPATAYAGDAGAAAGAAAGGTAGAVVGGPVGAAVGAGVGGVAGGAATGPDKKVIIDDHATETTGTVRCGSTTVHRDNDLGESKTVTRKNCD